MSCRRIELGVVLPQGRLRLDPGGVRAFAQAVQDLGFTHLFSFDHVLGADPARYADRALPFTTADPFLDVFALFGFVTAVAPRLGLCTGVLILPQRQTALVAKQAATVDILSGGQLRLGVGSGWNEVEYEALGVPWRQRGRRLDEQIAVLRRLWTSETVTFSGDFHALDAVGINPMPVQQPIPVWIGGRSQPALRRAALVGDGYLVPGRAPVDPAEGGWAETFDTIREQRAMEGRAGAFGFEARPVPASADDWEEAVRAWLAIGATHISVTTLGQLKDIPGGREAERRFDAGATVDDHIADLTAARSALDTFF